MSTAVVLGVSLPPRAQRVAGRAGVGGSLLLMILQLTSIANLIAPDPSPRASRGGGEDIAASYLNREDR